LEPFTGTPNAELRSVFGGQQSAQRHRFPARKDEYLVLAFLYSGALRKDDVLVKWNRYGVPPSCWFITTPVLAGELQSTAGDRAGRSRRACGRAGNGLQRAVRIRMLPGGRAALRRDAVFWRAQAVSGLPRRGSWRVENTMDRSTRSVLSQRNAGVPVHVRGRRHWIYRRCS